MTTALVVQHLPHEHDGVLGEVLVNRGVQIRRCRAWVDPVPAVLDGADALVVLGGDMNTDEDDRWPHLVAVRGLLALAARSEVPTMALCLGAQLLAEATGGSVHHGTPEIGYIPIRPTAAGLTDQVLGALPDRARMFNAHADHITAPADAVLLARSADVPVHAFRVGSAVGLQFHPEIDASFVAGYVAAPGIEAYLSANGWSGEALLAAAREHDTVHRQIAAGLFGAWVDTFHTAEDAPDDAGSSTAGETSSRRLGRSS